MSSDPVKAPTDLWGELRGQKARIEALEAENAQMKEESKADRLVLKALLEGARIENARLREALEPFSKESKIWAGYDDAEVLCEGFPNGPPSLINVGHLRAARRAREGGNADG